MRALGEQFTAQRLLQILKTLQETLPELSRSVNRRTDAELCLIRLSDEGLDESFAGLSARVARLEEQLAKGVPVQAQPVQECSVRARGPSGLSRLPRLCRRRSSRRLRIRPLGRKSVRLCLRNRKRSPPGLSRRLFRPAHPYPRLRLPQPRCPLLRAAPAQSTPAGGMQGGTSAFWPSFVAGLRGKVPASVLPYLNNPAKVTGVWKNKALTLWTDTEFTRAMLNKPPVLQGLAQAADVCFGVTGARVSVIAGKPPAEDLAAPAPATQAVPAQGSGDALDALLAFGEKFDNIKIQ